MLLAFALAAGSIAFAKLLFLGCMDEAWLGIRSPSGHTALSVSVYTMLALLISSQLRYRFKLLPHLMSFLLIAGIAVSRTTLGHHTLEEVLIGLTIGACCVITASMLLFYKRSQVDRFNVWYMIAIVIISAFLLHGIRLPAEQSIKAIAAMLKDYIPACN